MSAKHVVSDLIHHLLQAMQCDPIVAPNFSRFSDASEVWQSLLFCILSSQVRTSIAARATTAVLTEVPFFKAMLSSREVYWETKRILLRKDIGHRFPEVRSRQISYSWFSFAQIKDELYNYLDAFRTDVAARDAVMQLFPGLGLKQASMFLRDIGFSDRLCVIDTHVLWYCAHVGNKYRGALTPKKYLEIENYLLNQSDGFGVAPNLLDSAIWVAVKTFKARQCMMQFA